VDSLILATGGISYNSTGSNGEGIKIVEKLGHEIVSLRPGLVPLITDKKKPSSLEGLSLKDVCVKFEAEDKKIKTTIGDLIFTKNGISGPIVLSISGQIIDLLNNNINFSTSIDILPHQNKKEIERDLSNIIQNNPKKSISNVLKIKFPDRLIDYSMNVLDIDPFHKANQLKARQRNKIVTFLKSMKLDILGFESYEKAMITRGGISLKDIDPRIMSSKKIKGLFFAGEMIDINGDSGGYNLQAAFSTGFLAGNGAVRYIKSKNSVT
jgi:predicted Rossmann fold flavoprotein